MNRFDKIGIVLLIIGFLVPFFIYLGIVIGLPIYLLGVIIFYHGNLKVKKKIVLILIPIILFYPTMEAVSYLSFYFSDVHKIDLILPENFKGKAIIIDGHDFGQKFEKKDRREQIVFDENGIILYPSTLKLQSSRFRVFMQRDNGSLKEFIGNMKVDQKIYLFSVMEVVLLKKVSQMILTVNIFRMNL